MRINIIAISIIIKFINKKKTIKIIFYSYFFYFYPFSYHHRNKYHITCYDYLVTQQKTIIKKNNKWKKKKN